jgi:glycosyltransferase involved in cell wall biosynthesis
VLGNAISVVIPVFDGERLLGEAIESVLTQSLPAAEVVVVDDGSTDGSAKVAESFGSPVRVLRKPHRGVAAARNLGVQESAGELIALQDADDLMKPDRLERQAAALGRASSPALSLGRAEVRGEDGFVAPSWLEWAYANSDRYTPATLIATRSALELVGPFDETLTRGSDTDWLLRALEAGLRPVLIEEDVIVRRFHGGNLSYGYEGYRRAMFGILRRRAARQRAGQRLPDDALPATLLFGVPDAVSDPAGVIHRPRSGGPASA